MPHLTIQTNTSPSEDTCQALLFEASKEVSRELGKKEEFFMGVVQKDQQMIFGGNDDPIAVFELKALGLPGQKTKDLSRILCNLAESYLKVSKQRTYVKFHDVAHGMWGWNGDTL